jgi:N4-gp56 family major capsid protein
MNLTSTSQVDPAVSVYYDRVLLSRALPSLVHDRWAQKKSIKSKSGTMIKFRRYNSLSAATTPLVEGTPPPGQQLNKTDITAIVSQYGDFVHITDVVDLTVEDSVLTEANMLLGEQIGLTYDTLTRDILKACVTTVACAAGKNGDTPTEVTDSDLDAACDVLIGNNAKYLTGVIKASTGIGTLPLAASFGGIFHPNVRHDFVALDSWLPVEKYSNPGASENYEEGRTDKIRWLMTTNASTTGSGADTVYNLLIFGKDAYGTIDIEGGNLKSVIKDFGSGGTKDPLNQECTAGWKGWFVAKILNDTFMHMVTCTNSLTT